MAFQSTLEPGFRCVPISPAEAAASLRICVVIREKADAASGHFVLLRRTLDARVLLGAVVDSAGSLHEWTELWIQEVEDDTVNAVREANWAKLSASLEKSETAPRIALADSQGQPVFLDTTKWVPLVPAGDSANSVALCKDDKILLDAGLPPYSGTAARFGRAGSTDQFFALNPAAKSADAANQPPMIEGGEKTVALNRGAGTLFVRRFAPLAIDEFADILGGKAWSGLANARQLFRLGGVYQDLNDEATIRTKGRHFLGTRHDAAGRLAETLFLKIALLRQCMRAVARETQNSGLPLLNIEATSFRISLASTDSELPYCWTAQVSLVRPGESTLVEAPGSRTNYFTSRAAHAVSIFKPEELGLSRRGHGSVRLRRIFSPADGGLVAEGTLVAPDRLPIGTNELLRIALPLEGNKTFSLIGTIDPAMALAPGETGFRTIPMHLDDVLDKVLRSYEGTPFQQIPYEVIPPLSSPCDLYALGVLGLRILFAGSEITLATALDAMLSLGRNLATAPAGAVLQTTIAELFESDDRWMRLLGPQNVIKDPADGVIPIEVWIPVLAILVRFFPGLGSFSFCRDLAAAPTEAPHAIFTEPLNHLDILMLRLRSLCLSSWRDNSEIATLLSKHMTP